ncbi:DUF2937 family protein [Halovulum sp. GXIMD14793]
MRVIALVIGLMGGAGAAQFPEFSQQYLQRLSGAVDELVLVIADFDRSATRAGMTREQALGELDGTQFLVFRNQDMNRTFERHKRLSAERTNLVNSTALSRLLAAPTVADQDIAERTWADFKPALPVTLEGATFGAVGFVVTFILSSMILSLFGRVLFGRRRHAG